MTSSTLPSAAIAHSTDPQVAANDEPSVDAAAAPRTVSPGRRIWQRFKRNRLGFWSLVVFLTLYAVSLAGELVSNDRPLVAVYQGQWYFPLLKDYPESTFGGDLPIKADYNDPFIRGQLNKDGNWALYPPNPYYYDTLNYFSATEHYPGPPSKENWLGTDIAGYDIAARLLYGFRVSVTFALALTAAGIVLGLAIGAVQGYFAGKVDLFGQRLIEVWHSMPELYLLIIFASVFDHSFILLFVLLSLFAWTSTSDYVRAEVLRNRQLDYIKAAQAMGLSHWQIITRHILPNSLTPVITFLPFRMSAGITALAALDFLGLGVTAPAPSLGHLLNQGKANLDAWWISLATFTVFLVTLLLLTFTGDGLRNAMDPRVADEDDTGGKESNLAQPQQQAAPVGNTAAEPLSPAFPVPWTTGLATAQAAVAPQAVAASRTRVPAANLPADPIGVNVGLAEVAR